MIRPALTAASLLAAGALASSTLASDHDAPAFASTATVAASVAPSGERLLRRLQVAAPSLNRDVLALALDARACALHSGTVARAPRLAVIDYSRPSTEPRLWVFDLERERLLYAEHVAHGRGSGENFATAFSNRDGSYQSSLGLFATAETYVGGNGYSLRMDGLEPGFNDRARDRAIVMHGAPYVDPAQALLQGRLGRSLGCPALRPAVAQSLIDTLKDGQLVFAYYPDTDWLARSPFLRCGQSANATPTARGMR
ncbi:MAG: murein L,D-transpeptidase catalytic domain family protein [Xanthomonadaceae bacterium]|nr:murein L,D-transpeptidase catalytic domain family protein [Xanthomonadaceae bacterium]